MAFNEPVERPRETFIIIDGTRPSDLQIREMCSGSEAGSYLRRIDFVYHSTLGLRVIKKKKSGKDFY